MGWAPTGRLAHVAIGNGRQLPLDRHRNSPSQSRHWRSTQFRKVFAPPPRGTGRILVALTAALTLLAPAIAQTYDPLNWDLTVTNVQGSCQGNRWRYDTNGLPKSESVAPGITDRRGPSGYLGQMLQTSKIEPNALTSRRRCFSSASACPRRLGEVKVSRTDLKPCISAVLALCLLTAPWAQASRNHCRWMDDRWVAANDRPYRPIREELARRVKGKEDGTAHGDPITRDADSAWREWSLDRKDPVKLYRATLFLLNARVVDWKYAPGLIEDPRYKALFDAWLTMPSQNSYEFTRVGYMFVGTADVTFLLDPGSPWIEPADLGLRLVERNSADIGANATYVWVVSMVSSDAKHRRRAVDTAERLLKENPKRWGLLSLAGWAYDSLWRGSKYTDAEALATAIRYQRRFIAAAPEGFPLGTAKGILADRVEWYRKYHKKEPPK